jgi:hypothetical protein
MLSLNSVGIFFLQNQGPDDGGIKHEIKVQHPKRHLHTRRSEDLKPTKISHRTCIK